MSINSHDAAAQRSHADARVDQLPRDLNTVREFGAYRTRAEWEKHRDDVRMQILVSCGLYPLPPKSPLRKRIFDRVERDGYSIEKVALQTYPGFYLAGNLYRPLPPATKSALPRQSCPGVLVAHGHWPNGRMANEPAGCIAARAITFARQGCVAFTYDMVGYNDTRQIPHTFAADLNHWLWGISLMGLQTWNSMRALSFLESLPEVDRSRLAMTGESGGGTQTMMMGAVDDRLAAVAPCVMVSHTMQGGCLCENAPGLRVDLSNVDIAAAAAPKSQIIVGATGDWTRTTMTMEGPAVASVYALEHASDSMKYTIVDAGHNINKESREAVYAFFGAKLLHENDATKFVEPPFTMEPVKDLQVFPTDGSLPKEAKTAEQLTTWLKELARSEIEFRKPRDRRGLTRFKTVFRPAWKYSMAVDVPAGKLVHSTEGRAVRLEIGTCTRITIGRKGHGDSIPGLFYSPSPRGRYPTVLLVSAEGKSAFLEADGGPGRLVRGLLARRQAVLLIDAFLTGERADAEAEAARKRPFSAYFSTYNRTLLQERVQDLCTALAYLKGRRDVTSAAVVGVGKAGLWALLAAPAADCVAADCAHLDLTRDDALVTDDMFVPCLRRWGDFGTAAVLAAPHPLLLHNTGSRFTCGPWISEVYANIGAQESVGIHPRTIGDETLVRWLNEHNKPRRQEDDL